VLVEERLKIHDGQPVHVCKCSYLIEVATDSFLLPNYLVDAVGDNDFLAKSAPHNEIIQLQAVPLSQFMDTSALFFCAAYRYCGILLSNIIYLLTFVGVCL